MYNSIKEYYGFLKKQESEKEERLSLVKSEVNNQMDMYMSEHGWVRKGKGQKVIGGYVNDFSDESNILDMNPESFI